MRFQRGDIVTSAPGWTKGVYVITELTPNNPKNCYKGTCLVNHKPYRLSDRGLGQKVGTATAEFLSGGQTAASNPVSDNALYELGRLRAKREAMYGPNAAKWQLLADAKPGDRLTIHDSGRLQSVVFRHVLEKGQKYMFSATNRNGTTYRYPLAALITTIGEPIAGRPLFGNVPVEAPPPPVAPVSVSGRPVADIMRDLEDVDCGLSPENLSCDGERPPHEVRARRNELLNRRAALLRELGRMPTMALVAGS